MKMSGPGYGNARLKRWLFFAILITALFPATLLGQQIVLKVAYDHWPPWKIATENEIGGIDAAILKAIEKRSDYRFEFITASWRRCIELIKQGQADLITNFIKNEERQAFAVYVHPHYYMDRVRFYGLKDRRYQLAGYPDLYQYRIGTVRGAHYHERFDQDPQIRRVVAVDEAPLIRMLFAGRVDLIANWEIPFDYQIEKLKKTGQVKKCRYHFFPPDAEPESRYTQPTSFFAISKKSPHRGAAKHLSEMIKEMVENNEIETLIQQFLSQPAKQP